ncbi:hypothetical protein BGW37DRAFT_466906 [Umbelopsis sp. PMI_123]|nr:hypothetical protein BGW37DRAFT_466906 [Umbelopsis sp. PMI_123]
MSAYDHVASGSLKLKGSSSGITKKKKKSKKSKLEDATRHAVADEKKRSTYVAVEKTPAELKFEETQRRRQEEKIRRSAEKSHKEKVAEFNQKLEELSEHYDIPKVGPG